MIFDRKNSKVFVFLQHGIIKDDVSNILGPHSKIDLFICGAKPEYEYIKNKFGYKENQVVYTGLSRFDTLEPIENKKSILIMPTWRSYMEKYNNKLFLQSEYYKRFQSLINNKYLIEKVEKEGYEVIFYPHYEIQKYLDDFKSTSENIKIASKDQYDVQVLLREAKLLITDFSSVFFDFAYMDKPVIYYQFDREKFTKDHYKKGYFDYDIDGFGDVFFGEDKLVEKINLYIDNNFELEKKYQQRINRFFEIKDKNNSSRIYNEIENYRLKNNFRK